MFALWRHDRHAFRNFYACLFERRNFVRIVRHQLHGVDSEMLTDRARQTVVAQVHPQAQSFVGLYGVLAFVLQLVGAQFIDNANAAAFFHLVDHQPAAFLGNRGQGNFQLLPAIATQAVEDIAR